MDDVYAVFPTSVLVTLGLVCDGCDVFVSWMAVSRTLVGCTKPACRYMIAELVLCGRVMPLSWVLTSLVGAHLTRLPVGQWLQLRLGMAVIPRFAFICRNAGHVLGRYRMVHVVVPVPSSQRIMCSIYGSQAPSLQPTMAALTS